ncbi:phosphotransferase family protein [Streptomyces sp. PU-14G]|uniref:phosphotransferase family protein n=1 Tax=Streptomyces sp. PU-14G TaxID=2800808 RepID=UPI0034DED8D4
MTTTRTEASWAVLEKAAAAADLRIHGAEVIRLSENDLWRLPDDVVARVARAGQEQAAAREVAVTRWLAKEGVPAVRPLDVDQPVLALGRPTTFWEELPPHRSGSGADLAPLLRRLHDLPPPGDLPLDVMDPFVRLEDRLLSARILPEDDRRWLLDLLADLRAEWAQLPSGRQKSVIHGDAWAGNCAVTSQGEAYLLDFERTALGHPEWDLTSTAVGVDTLGNLSHDAYEGHCSAYGYDVRTWEGYPTMRAIRELRMTSFAFQAADERPEIREQAMYRLSCLRGRGGPRPWGWQSLG